jgi:Holliday junction resolvase RusA-like endonuclease
MSNGVRWSPEVYAAHQRKQALDRRKGDPKERPKNDAPTVFRVILPYPPSVNHSHELNADGSRRLSAEARAFRENASAIAAMEFKAQEYETLHGPVSVVIDLIPPDARRRDVDNPLKQILDALQAAQVFADDNQVRRLEATMLDPMIPGEGRCSITVRNYPR